MSDLDVLIIGGYGVDERQYHAGDVLDKLRLHSNGHLATVDFLETFVSHQGSLTVSETEYRGKNRQRFLVRSLNVIYLWDFLRQHGVIVDAVNYFRLEPERFSTLMSAKPKIVAISTTYISDIDQIIEIAEAARAISPQSLIIAGGAKIFKSFKKYDLFTTGYFDGVDVTPMIRNNFFFTAEQDRSIDGFVIEQCGELTLLELINRVKANRDWRTIPNIAYREGEDLILTDRQTEPFTFAANPIHWETVPEEILGHEIPVWSGMGCPFKCAFCDFVDLHQIKLRSIESVVDEIERIQKRFPGRPIYFADDNLFTNGRRTATLCRTILSRGLKFKWRGFFRCDSVNEDNISLIADSGCTVAILGVESGSDKVLKTMDKKLRASDILRAVRLLDAAGINTVSTYIVGFPGETLETISETVGVLNDYPVPHDRQHVYYPQVFHLLPLSPAMAPDFRARFELVGLFDKWRHSTMDYSEAREHLWSMFHSIKTPTLFYPEAMLCTTPARFNALARARDMLIHQGVTEITETNAKDIYAKFAAVLG